MKRLLLLAPLLLLLACAGPRDAYLSRNEISVRIHDQPGLAGSWDRAAKVVSLSFNRPRATLAHELCHACDSLDLPLDDVLFRMGNLSDELGYEYELAVEVAAKAQANPGRDAHWRAPSEVCGSWSVGHAEILARIKK